MIRFGSLSFYLYIYHTQYNAFVLTSCEGYNLLNAEVNL